MGRFFYGDGFGLVEGLSPIWQYREEKLRFSGDEIPTHPSIAPVGQATLMREMGIKIHREPDVYIE